jgi:hypothetical protein
MLANSEAGERFSVCGEGFCSIEVISKICSVQCSAVDLTVMCLHTQKAVVNENVYTIFNFFFSYSPKYST